MADIHGLLCFRLHEDWGQHTKTDLIEVLEAIQSIKVPTTALMAIEHVNTLHDLQRR
jgi:hypothetical protein